MTKETSDLLLDKVIELDKSPDDVMSLTSDILKQRESIKEKLLTELNKESSVEDEDSSSETSDETEEGSDTEDDPFAEDEDMDIEEDTSDFEDEPDATDEEDVKDTEDSKDTKEEDKKKEEEAAKKEEEEKAKEEEKKKEEEEKAKQDEDSKDKNKEAKESYSLKLNSFYAPIKSTYSKYLTSLEEFSLSKKLSLEEQPVVYTKEAVSETLNNLIKLLDTYIKNNEAYKERYTKTSKTLNEKLTILSTYAEQNKLTFTNKLIDDTDLLAKISTKENSSIRDNLKKVIDLTNDVKTLVEIISRNTFDKLEDSFFSTHFKEDEKYGDLSYNKVVPGFVLFKASIPDYKTYIETDLENFTYYSVRTVKIQDLYELKAVTLSEEKDLEYVLTNLEELLLKLTGSIDRLTYLNSRIGDFIKLLKNVVYDVEHDVYDQIKDIDIDSRVKTLIKYKLLSDINAQTIDYIVDYILSILTVLDKTVKIGEVDK